MRPTTTPKNDGAGRQLRPVAMPLSPDELVQIDDVRFGKRFASRVETMRYLLNKGLEAERNERA